LELTLVDVTAFSTPNRPDWRWRIVTYAGEMIEESYESFATIALAITEGTKRMTALNVVDRSVPARIYRSTSHLRTRA
jgi:hypothetical protein